VTQFGPAARGVDWNAKESHLWHFDERLRLTDEVDDVTSKNHYGCGHGALADHLRRRAWRWRYTRRHLRFDDRPHDRGAQFRRVALHASCFIGVNDTLRNSTISERTWIGAGTVILKHTGAGSFYPGTRSQRISAGRDQGNV